MSDLNIRRATLDDLDFVTDAFVAAEQSGTAASIYERVFELTQAELRDLARNAISEGVGGSELCIENFLLALVGGARAGCIATWIEADESLPSAMLKATLLSHFLGASRWRAAQSRLKTIAQVDIARQPGAFQIESVYVAADYRGRRLTSALIEDALEALRGSRPDCKKAQILSVLVNDRSAKAFAHAGFAPVNRTEADTEEVRRLFPGGGRVLWERDL